MSRGVHKRFNCRHCGNPISVYGKSFIHEGERANLSVQTQGIQMESYICNMCGKVNVCVTTKHYKENMEEITTKVKGKVKDLFVFPIHNAPVKIKNVPAKYLNEYNEARNIKEISPKACALLCRRIMEIILQNECGCTKFNLSDKVIEFNTNFNPPEIVRNSMKYIIDAGNAVAHNKVNLKDDLIRISSADCDELLEAIERLFQIVFIDPKKGNRLVKKMKKVEAKRTK